ncbi:MAG: transporter [Bacteroidota bacterium]
MNHKLFAIGLVVSTGTMLAQQPTMHTESALTLGKGKVQAGLAVEYLRKNSPTLPDFPQSLWRVLVLGWHHGVAENVNFDLDWLGGLTASFPNGSRGFDWGDLMVSTKITFIRENESVPAIGVRTMVKLPNSSYAETRLGSNKTDFHSYLLLSKHFDDIETRLNLGFSIVGDPLNVNVQDDVYGFNAALITPIAAGAVFFIELVGFSGYTDHNSKLLSRYGMMLDFDVYECSIYSSFRAAGDDGDFGNAFEASENWSIGFSVTRTFGLSLE